MHHPSSPRESTAAHELESALLTNIEDLLTLFVTLDRVAVANLRIEP